MMKLPDILNLLGALSFGLVVGWVTSGILRRAKREALTDITTVKCVTLIGPSETSKNSSSDEDAPFPAVHNFQAR